MWGEWKKYVQLGIYIPTIEFERYLVRVLLHFDYAATTYPALERVTALHVHSIISHHVLECIVHVATLTSVVTIGYCKGVETFVTY